MSYSPEAFARSFIGNQSLKVGTVLEPTYEEISTIAELFAKSGRPLTETLLQQVTKQPPTEIRSIITTMGRRIPDNQDGGGRKRRH